MLPTVDQLARAYGIPGCIDYQVDDRGVLFSSGDGLLMSLMDQLPMCRYAVRVEHLNEITASWRGFLEAINWVASPIVVAGWFMLDKPEPIYELVRACREDLVVHYLMPDTIAYGYAARSIPELVAECRRREAMGERTGT